MTNSAKTVGASVRTRLLRLARERTEDFQHVLTRYANERLLFRLATSRHAPHFVLKGAALFTLWTGKPHRATRDLDLLGFGDLGEENLRDVFADVLTLEVADDGVTFDLGSLEVGPIRQGKDYGGMRIEFVAHITSARVRLQVDVAFGDAVTPEATELEFPPLLDFPAPRIRTYPRETVVAEKVEAMVQLGLANSRMKDFYDLVVLARMFDFDGEGLARAIRATFARRRTPLPTGLPLALTAEFAEDSTKKTQWAGFVRKAGLHDTSSLSDTVAEIAAFLRTPLLAATAPSPPLVAFWRAGGPWG